jgi:hypothetical protein
MQIAQVLRLAARKIDQPSPRFHRDHRLASRPRTVIQGGQNAMRHRPLDAALHCLVMQAKRTSDRKKRDGSF